MTEHTANLIMVLKGNTDLFTEKQKKSNLSYTDIIQAFMRSEYDMPDNYVYDIGYIERELFQAAIDFNTTCDIGRASFMHDIFYGGIFCNDSSVEKTAFALQNVQVCNLSGCYVNGFNEELVNFYKG